MQNSNRTLHYAFATIAFVVSLMTYMLTVQPSVPFWDCGEFTAAAVQQQVPHPPGAPLFLMLGKLFHLLPFGDPGWRVNLVSVFASAATILLLYLITVRVIRTFWKEDLEQTGNAVLLYGSGLVAALTYTFTDTFWFNAVESEVYAASSVFVALIVWLMMLWNDKAEEHGHERYLLLIAYVIGLSTGVHLLSILTIFSIVLLVYLRKYPFKITTLLLTMVLGLVIFYVTYSLVILKLPAFFAGTIPFFRSEAREYPITDNFLAQLIGYGALIAAAYGIYYGRKKSHEVLSLGCTAFLLIVLGYSTYGHILVRANSNPPMNENAPTTLEKLVSYLGREQYGDNPGWPRRYSTEDRYTRLYPDYGKWEAPGTKQVDRKDGTTVVVPDYSRMRVNSSGELNYLWDYQLVHMYWRYFGWNFIGRESDVQDAGVAFMGNKKVTEQYSFMNGMARHFPVRLWAIPFVLGLIGLVFHFKRDPRRAWVYLVLFLMTGALAALQQNQQQPQPRERDYFYVASFMVWAMWAGMGAFAIGERLRSNVPGIAGAMAALVLVGPVNMAMQNWAWHSRTGNYLAFDYAYNILQSAEPNAIIFTNGDNDTFPVWYLQDVAGVRRDVRIVNLSLGNTTWYVDQLKNRSPWGAEKLPLSFSDESLQVSEDDSEALSYTRGRATVITVPVDRAILAKFTNDTAVINAGTMSWTFTGMRRGESEYLFTIAHQMIADIIKQTRFTRPLYFSSSVGVPEYTEEFVGLGNHLRMEGMCYRICPTVQSRGNDLAVNIPFMEKSMLGATTDDSFETGFSPHLKFRNLANPNVYYDDVNRGYVENYRNVFYRYASYLVNRNDSTHTVALIRKMNQLMSPEVFPMSTMYALQFASMLDRSGDKEGAAAMARMALVNLDAMIAKPELVKADRQMQDSKPSRIAVEASILAGDFARAKKYYQRNEENMAPELLKYKLAELDLMAKERANDYEGALAMATEMRNRYAAAGDQLSMQIAGALQDHIDDYMRKLGRAPAPAATTQQVVTPQ